MWKTAKDYYGIVFNNGKLVDFSKMPQWEIDELYQDANNNLFLGRTFIGKIKKDRNMGHNVEYGNESERESKEAYIAGVESFRQQVAAAKEKNDPINRPAHYTAGRKFEPIDVIRDWDLNFSLGNAVKYVSRAGRKDPAKTVEDLKKAIWYIQNEIDSIEKSK